MKYPRVTEILNPYNGYNEIPEHILKAAAGRGSRVHALCAAIANGNWLPDGMIEDELKGYVESFRKWSEAQVSEFWLIEQRYEHEDLKYTGQIDFVIIGNDDQFYLVDLKTTAKLHKSHTVQMAAYNLLLNKWHIEPVAAMLVYLNKNGDFPEIEMLEDMKEETDIFLSALRCWHYFNKEKHGKSIEKT